MAIGQMLNNKPDGKKSPMMDLLLDTEGLVVYRSSPAQKADIVKYVRNAREK
jgi:magnesium-transporting ATPase (P-type)